MTLLPPGLHVAEVTGVPAGTHGESSCGSEGTQCLPLGLSSSQQRM